jgi:hypothetical protein
MQTQTDFRTELMQVAKLARQRIAAEVEPIIKRQMMEVANRTGSLSFTETLDLQSVSHC